MHDNGETNSMPEKRRQSDQTHETAPQFDGQLAQARATLAPPAAQSEEDRAVALLKDLLAQGPLPATQIFAAAQDANISIPTLKRAKSRLGCIHDFCPCLRMLFFTVATPLFLPY